MRRTIEAAPFPDKEPEIRLPARDLHFEHGEYVTPLPCRRHRHKTALDGPNRPFGPRSTRGVRQAVTRGPNIRSPVDCKPPGCHTVEQTSKPPAAFRRTARRSIRHPQKLLRALC